MPLSVHYRHGTNNQRLKSFVQNSCKRFLEYYPEVSNLKVVFDKQRIARNESTRGLCHISLRAAGKTSFDTFEEQVNTRFAFERALESTSNFLIHSCLLKRDRNTMEAANESH